MSILYYGTGGEFGYLSNQIRCPITIDGNVFLSNIHYILYRMYGKFESAAACGYAKSLTDIAIINKVFSGFPTREEYDEKEWLNIVDEVTDTCNMAKFTQHPELGKKLLATSKIIIAEACPNEYIWGIGVGKAKGKDVKNWKGRNTAGSSLMRVRTLLANDMLYLSKTI